MQLSAGLNRGAIFCAEMEFLYRQALPRSAGLMRLGPMPSQRKWMAYSSGYLVRLNRPLHPSANKEKAPPVGRGRIPGLADAVEKVRAPRMEMGRPLGCVVQVVRTRTLIRLTGQS